MGIAMTFEKMNEKHVEACVALAVAEYEAECKKCTQLLQDDFAQELTGLVQALATCKYSKVAIEEGEVIGFAEFWGPIDGFFGNVKGAFSPLGGSAFAGKDKAKTASMLFENMTDEMLAMDQICSIAYSRYAHDEEVGRAFVMNGFGIRCSDAMMYLPTRHVVEAVDEQYTYCELLGEDKKQIRELKLGLSRHLLHAPVFLPADLNCFDEWFAHESIRVFVIKENDKLIGYMSLDEEAENFVTAHESVYNICGAYMDPEYRGGEVASQLLEYICRVSEEAGKKYLGVDCETLNPKALRFWGKHFDNYTYSYHRRIDERVIGNCI